MELQSQGRLRGQIQKWTARLGSNGRFRLGPLEMGVILSLMILGIGIGIGLEFDRSQKDQFEITEQEHLLSQSRIYQASIQHQLDQIRTNVLESSEADLSLLGVRHWAQILIEETNSGPTPVINFSEAIQIPAEIQVSYVQFLKNKMATLVEVHKQSPKSHYAFLFPMALQQFSEWLLITFPPNLTPEVNSKSEKPQWLTVLVDPAVAFSLFSSVANAAQTLTTRAFLVSQSGYVVTHSQKAYAGANLSTRDFFLQGILPKFESSTPSQTTFQSFEAIDHLPVQASLTRIDGFPLALVVEKVQGPSESRMESLKRASVLRFSGKLLLGLGGILALAFTAALYGSRRKALATPPASAESDLLENLIITTVIPPDTMPDTTREATPEPTSPEAPPAESPELSTAEPTSEEESPKLPVHVTFAEANTLSREFERDTKDLKDSKAILALLVEKASRILESPVLFLRYESKNQVLSVEARSGFEDPQLFPEIHVSVSPEVQAQILSSIRVHQIPFFGEWRPLAKSVLATLNIAHFEAWGITLPVSDPENYEGQKKTFPFLGVLVVLQPGVQSTLHQPSLFRMIRTTGLVHIANDIWKRNALNLQEALESSSTSYPSRGELTRALWELSDDQSPQL